MCGMTPLSVNAWILASWNLHMLTTGPITFFYLFYLHQFKTQVTRLFSAWLQHQKLIVQFMVTTPKTNNLSHWCTITCIYCLWAGWPILFCGSTRETVSVITQKMKIKGQGGQKLGQLPWKDCLATVEVYLAILRSTVLLALKGEHLSPLGSPSPSPP